MRVRIISVFIFSIWLSSCIEPYNPVIIGEQGGKIVIEGMITDQPGQQRVYLTRTSSFTDANQNHVPEVSGAEVEISDNEGNIIVLQETLSPGIYASEPDEKGIIGRSYQLRVVSEGKEYLSEPELLLPSADPASINAAFAHELIDESSGEIQRNKVLFYLDVKNREGAADFYKYSIDYTYEIEVPFWQTPFECGDPTKTEETPKICYVQEKPAPFLNILSLKNLSGSSFQDHYLSKVEPNRRFMNRFSINVKQYSMTERAYEYWEDIQAQSLRTGSLFDPTPGRILGNLYSASDPDEAVFGYFMASSVKEKRSFFTQAVLQKAFKNFKNCDCFPEKSNECGLLFATELPPPDPTCCDCRLYPNASAEKPSFWPEK